MIGQKGDVSINYKCNGLVENWILFYSQRGEDENRHLCQTYLKVSLEYNTSGTSEVETALQIIAGDKKRSIGDQRTPETLNKRD